MISLWDAALLTVQNQGQVWDTSTSLNSSSATSLQSEGKSSSKSRTRNHQRDEGVLLAAQMDYLKRKGFLKGVLSMLVAPKKASLPNYFHLSSLVQNSQTVCLSHSGDGMVMGCPTHEQDLGFLVSAVC